MKKPLYHYTSASSLFAIIEDGEIKPATLHVEKTERPAVWLSYASEWEQTANKSIRDTETGKEVFCRGPAALSKYETPCRFQVNPDNMKVVSWNTFKQKSGIRPSVAAGLHSVAVKAGASPNEWRACFEPIPLENCIEVEIWQDGAWHSLQECMEGKRGLLIAGKGLCFHKNTEQ
jgi:hypothetical protein